MTFRQMSEAFAIFARYEDKGMEAHLGGADHDVIYGPSADFDAYVDGLDPDAYVEEHGEYPNYQDSRMSTDDNAKLYSLGWHIDPDHDCWKSYV